MLDTLTALVASIAVATAAGLTLAPLASGLKNGVGEELSAPDPAAPYQTVVKEQYPTAERRHSTIYYPDTADPQALPVVAFAHGYFFFDINDIYEDTLANLASQGYIVLSLNYEDIFTDPQDYVDIAASQIADGLRYAEELETVAPMLDENGQVMLGLIGHSAGGVTMMNLASCWRDYGLPKPQFVFTMSACDGGSNLVPMYDAGAIDPDTNILMTFGEEEDDNVWATNETYWNEMTQIPAENKQWIVLYSDANGEEQVVADHGWMTSTNASTVDNLRRYGCWKWSVALANDTFFGEDRRRVLYRRADALGHFAFSGQ